MKHLSAKAPNIPTELALLNCSAPGFSTAAYLPIQQLSVHSFQVKVGVFSPHLDSWMLNGRRWRGQGGRRNIKYSPGEIKSCFNLLCSWLIHDSGKGGEFDQTVTKWPHFKFLCFLWPERKKKSLLMLTMEMAFLLYSSQLPAGCDSRKASLLLLSLMLLGLSSLSDEGVALPLWVWPSHNFSVALT